MSEKQGIIKSIIVLTLICLMFSGLLAVVNSFTDPVSKANAAAREAEARQEVLLEADYFEEIDITGYPKTVQSGFIGIDEDGTVLGYIFTVSTHGFDSEISVMCAIGPDGKIIRCATLDVSGETKTLGGKTASPAYTDQYIGVDDTLEGVDGISGATITSMAYETCVRDALSSFRLATKEANT